MGFKLIFNANYINFIIYKSMSVEFDEDIYIKKLTVVWDIQLNIETVARTAKFS